MGRNKGSRKKSDTYNETRRKILLEDNEKEDKLIKRLSKKLKIPTNTNRSKQKSRHPAWMRQYGLDYILDFEEELKDEKQDESVSQAIGVSSKKKKKKKVDIYGQKQLEVQDDDGLSEKPSDDDISVEDLFMNDSLPAKSGNTTTVHDSGVSKNDHDSLTESVNVVSSELGSLRRSIRSWLNKVSETQMFRVVAELTNLFSAHPRATVRSVLIEELYNLLGSAPVNTRSNTGWLQQELAVCVACVHISLHLKLQHDNLVSYVVEKIVDNLFDGSGNFRQATGSASFCLFLSYLYRFEVLSAKLVFDVMQKLLEAGSLSELKVMHFICTAIGVNLRKSDLKACQDIVQKATTMLTHCTSNQIEMICQLESIIQRLSEKHSKNEGVAHALHLKKMMRTWTKVNSLPDDVCLPVNLSDILNRESKGRWWIVGVADKNASQSTTASVTTTDTLPKEMQCNFSPEVEAAAARLGLRTETRKLLFNSLVSTPGGPDATATALIKVCGGLGGGSHAGSASREREMIQIVVHCLMAENPFNRFYPRVLGGLMNSHRRFLMMIKCAFWDVMKKTELSVNAKANAGEALGLLVLVYDLPLTVLKNFNFGDASEANVAFLKHALAELCTGDYKTVFCKLMQLSCYTHLSRNCRIFMRKHFSQDPDSHVKACILRLVTDMRNSESF